MAQPHATTTVIVSPQQPTVQTTTVVHRKEGNSCRAAIPAMHMAMAVTCLILNIFFPGIGTIVAGFSVFCCGNPGQSGMGKFGTMCLNFWVGILQLATTLLFFVGWIWSIMWGAAFIAMSNDYHQTNKTTRTLVTTSTPGAVVVAQTTPQQPQPQPQAYAAPPPQGYNPQPLLPQGYSQPPPQGYNQPPPQGYNKPPPPEGYPPPQGYNPQPPPQGYNPTPQVYSQAPPQGYAHVATTDYHQQSAASAPPPTQQAYPPQPAYNPQVGQEAPPPYNPNVEEYPQKLPEKQF